LGVPAIKVLVGYGYHPTTTATYIQRALECRASTTYVGTPWASHPGFARGSDLRELVAALPVKPDLYLYVDSGAAWYFPRGLTELECPTACYLIDVHVGGPVRLKQAMFFDYAFSAQRDFVDELQRAGHPQAHWLPLACDPEVHRRYDLPKRLDIGFVGATVRHKWYMRRRHLLEQLARRYTVSDYSQSYTPAEMARLYSESHMVFNCALRNEINMRLFEGMATGTTVLTDRIGNGLSELVTDREHVVIYDDDQLVDLVDEFLRDDVSRERIARQGYEHVRAHHTYGHRVTAILDTVFEPTGGPCLCAPLRGCTDAQIQLAYAEMFQLGGEVDDIIDQLKRLPPSLRYRIPVARQLTVGLMRRVGRTLLHKG
jgi:hypothetical protein